MLMIASRKSKSCDCHLEENTTSFREFEIFVSFAVARYFISYCSDSSLGWEYGARDRMTSNSNSDDDGLYGKQRLQGLEGYKMW